MNVRERAIELGLSPKTAEKLVKVAACVRVGQEHGEWPWIDADDVMQLAVLEQAACWSEDTRDRPECGQEAGVER